MHKNNLLRPISLLRNSGLSLAKYKKKYLCNVFLGLGVGAALSKLFSKFQKCAILLAKLGRNREKIVHFLRFGDKGWGCGGARAAAL